MLGGPNVRHFEDINDENEVKFEVPPETQPTRRR